MTKPEGRTPSLEVNIVAEVKCGGGKDVGNDEEGFVLSVPLITSS